MGVVAELRLLADGLRPPALDDLGLETSLRQLVQAFSVRTGLGAEVRTRGRELPLDRERRTDVYRIVQEALGNVERHAGARRVLVRIIFTLTAVRVEVADDGQGFSAASSPAGRGVVAMRERAALAGGRVDIRALPGQGTRVLVTVPVSDTREVGGRPSRELPPASVAARRAEPPTPPDARAGTDVAVAAQA
jgi:two-component system sensor histidine kinase DegS